VYDTSITHNLTGMAGEAGIYKHLWRPEELGVKHAWELIVPLERALLLMREEPERFRKHDAPNGWGTYDAFVPWLERLLDACRADPEAEISVSR
jgi:hypothetical protein